MLIVMKSKLPPTLTQVTFFSKMIALFLFILFPFAGFYMGMNYQRVQDSHEVSTIMPTYQPTPTIVPNGQVLTLISSDNGKTFTVPLHANIFLSLNSSTMHWTVTLAKNTILRPIILGIAQREGDPITGRFTAIQKGTTQITAEGSSVCKANTPCPQLLMHYAVTIIVK